MPSPCGDTARHLFLSGLGALVFIAGCAGTGADTRRRLDDLEQQVVLVHNRNDRLEERVAALEAALESEHAQSQTTEEAPPSDDHRPGLPVVRLRPNVEEPVEDDPAPDVLESQSVNQSPGDQSAGAYQEGIPKTGNQGKSKKTRQKGSVPETEKPREVIKVHGSGPQSRLSAPGPYEVQSTCPA